MERNKTCKGLKANKKKNRSLFYRVSAWLHLWLGLISGIIVVIVCLTACIWVFKEEITVHILDPQSKIAYQEKPILSPADLYRTARELYPDKKIASARYLQGRAVNISIGDSRKPEAKIKLDPYTGKVIAIRTNGDPGETFFRSILNGHRFLWLPYKIGRPVVNYSILIFVITLISGLVLWYPKKWNKSTRDKSFKIKFGGTFKRLNYDLHNVLGFYSLLILLVLGLTGIVYGIEWFSRGLYWTTSGGRTLPKYERYESDSTKIDIAMRTDEAIDMAWNRVLSENRQAKGFNISFPDTSDAKSTINITVYSSIGRSYDNISYTFDRYTLHQIPKHEINGEKFQTASFPVKLRKMNYDLHIGSILGLPTKIIAFFASLIGASLPVTGFILWWGKKKGKKKPPRKRWKGNIDKSERSLVHFENE